MSNIFPGENLEKWPENGPEEVSKEDPAQQQEKELEPGASLDRRGLWTDVALRLSLALDDQVPA